MQLYESWIRGINDDLYEVVDLYEAGSSFIAQRYYVDAQGTCQGVIGHYRSIDKLVDALGNHKYKIVLPA